MTRKSRIYSESGVYHVMLRGVNKQQIFENAEDYSYFLSILRMLAEKTESGKQCTIYAYCLMNNHVHLLLKEDNKCISDIMQIIASSYVFYYNKKYERVGHLFQERFKSQPVCSFEYFVTLLRYIHQNPVKSHLTSRISDYPWSSWQEYLGCSGFCSVQAVINRVGLAELKELVEFSLSDDETAGILDIATLKYVNKPKLPDADAWKILSQLSGTYSTSEFQKLQREIQKTHLISAHKLGISVRSLARITGIPYSVIQRFVSKGDSRVKGTGTLDPP
ncbi:MAG: transposase [Paludibacteraceae bacterium]|nr:transposase [Paludibacteraceae bacterium]